MSRYQNAKTRNVKIESYQNAQKLIVSKNAQCQNIKIPKNSKCLNLLVKNNFNFPHPALERQPPILVTQNSLKHHRINSASQNNMATQNIRL